MKTAQEKQGYRIKTAHPVCINCAHASIALMLGEYHICQLGSFRVDLALGTCKLHEWRK